MKILLVDNHTQHMKELRLALADHDVEVQVYQPGIKFNDQGKDLVILSGGGGEGRELHDKIAPTNQLWYEDEMRYVHTCEKPIIGICMGFEIIACAYGAKIEKMKKGVEEYYTSRTTIKGLKQLKSAKLHQFEAHDYAIKKVPRREFKVLARSKHGIEAIKHRKRPIFATQFHPEYPDGTLKLKELVGNI